MGLFTWQPAYAVGLSQIDNEHAQLFELADDLLATVAQGASANLAHHRLAILIDHTRAHFAHEEGLMTEAAFPGLALHKAEHAELIARATEFQNEFSPERAARNAEAFRFLKEWLTQHIGGSDRRLAEYLTGVAGRPARAL